MNKVIKSSLVILGSSMLITPVLAETVKSNSAYIAVDAGYGKLATPDKNFATVDGDFITDASHDRGSFVGGASVGVNHKINPHFLAGAEFGYDYNGQSKYTVDMSESDLFNLTSSETTKISSWDLHLLATGTYLLNNGVNLFAKAGAARVEQKAKVEGTGFDNFSDSETTTGYKPMLAAGVGYLYKNMDFYVQYSHIFAENASNFDDLVDANGVLNIASTNAVKAGVSFNIAI